MHVAEIAVLYHIGIKRGARFLRDFIEPTCCVDSEIRSTRFMWQERGEKGAHLSLSM